MPHLGWAASGRLPLDLGSHSPAGPGMGSVAQGCPRSRNRPCPQQQIPACRNQGGSKGMRAAREEVADPPPTLEGCAAWAGPFASSLTEASATEEDMRVLVVLQQLRQVQASTSRVSRVSSAAGPAALPARSSWSPPRIASPAPSRSLGLQGLPDRSGDVTGRCHVWDGDDPRLTAQWIPPGRARPPRTGPSRCLVVASI